MSANLSQQSKVPKAASQEAKPARRSGGNDILIYVVLVALVLITWKISRKDYFEAGDDIGYWLGVAGGVMMLLLFTYPLRKHFRFAQGWGRTKWWFLAHMLLGVGGPLLILLHSTFRVGSLNAGVALYSMIIVAISGVIGRFIYARVHRGLNGEVVDFNALRKRAGMDQADACSRLSFAPLVEQKLKTFEEAELNAKPGWASYCRQVFWLPVHQHMVYRECTALLRPSLEKLAQQQHWSNDDLTGRNRRAKKLVRNYLQSVVGVAQYTAYERFFSLWHVAHIPFVYLLVISAIVHVIAVHAY